MAGKKGMFVATKRLRRVSGKTILPVAGGARDGEVFIRKRKKAKKRPKKRKRKVALFYA